MSDRTASGAPAETALEAQPGTTDSPAAKPANGGSSLRAGAFDELRSLLVGPEQKTLNKLQQQVSDLPTAVADVLPQAVKHSSRENSKLGDALLPVTEDNIEQSVKRNPRILADALFPIIGPATRKAITEALGQMVQSMNQTLEHSFSGQGLKWRAEGWRTGRSFAEVVMLHTLLYRVEQVFLIHKETGLLLQHVSAAGAVTQDADMVSGMMTAIQDFVQDSFQGNPSDKGGTLDTLRVGELVVWIEQGPKAVLAGVIRGKAPEDLRLVFDQTLEKIHADYSRELKSFEGDTLVFEGTRPELESCLQAQYDTAKEGAKPKKRIKPLHVIAAVALLAILVGGFFWVREYRRWNAYVARLQNTPGIVLISADRGWTRYFVRGLRDPLAAEPNTFATEAGLNPQKIEAVWEPYQALDEQFVIKRANKVLQPPDSVHLSYRNGDLLAAGVASREWIDRARTVAPALAGVAEYRDTDVIAADRQQFILVKQRLEKMVLRFEDNSTQLIPAQESAIGDMVLSLQQIDALAANVAPKVRFQLVGHTDSKGTENINNTLSQQRAEAVRDLLLKDNVPAGRIDILGAGTKEPLRAETTDADREYNRSVTVRIVDGP